MAKRQPAAQPSPWWLRALIVLGYAIALAVILKVGWSRRAKWSSELVDKGIGGDGIQYWAMAVHIERDHMISLDGKEPTWLRLPGYPVLLRYTTHPAESDDGATDPKVIQHHVDAWLKRAVKVNLRVDLGIAVGAFLLALALGGGPISLAAALAWALQPWSSVVAIHTLSDPLATLLTTLCLAALVMAVRSRRLSWIVLAAVLAGLAQYVRADSILLLPAILAGAVLTPGSNRDRATRIAVASLTWCLVFAPWPLRNYHRFGALHPLGSSGMDAKGKPIDRDAAFAWMRTWCTGHEYETTHVAWKLPGQAVSVNDLPAAAIDNAVELDTLRAFLRDYNLRGAVLDVELTERLRAITAERKRGHRFDYWVRLPLLRIKHRLLPPRDGFGLGSLPVLRAHRAQWIDADLRVTFGGLLALLLLLALTPRRGATAAVITWLLLRFALLGWYPAPEPRYLLEALPLLVAAASTLPATLTDLALLFLDRLRQRAKEPTQPA